MTKYFTFFLLLFSGLSQLAFAQNSFNNVDATQFMQLTSKGDGIILDVRTPNEYHRGHIEGSTLISVADRDFVSKISLLQKDKPIYIYCLTGSRSRAAATYLVSKGFAKVYNLQRGIMEWHQNGYPLIQSNQQLASKSKAFTIEEFTQLTKSNNLVFVDFHAPWCAPCKNMMPTIDKVTSEFHGKVKVEKIDVDANQQIAQHKQIASIPGFILYKNGQEVWRHKGEVSYEELEKLFESHL